LSPPAALEHCCRRHFPAASHHSADTLESIIRPDDKKIQPFTPGNIAAEALSDWLEKNGYAA
jgi:hypothetical protein